MKFEGNDPGFDWFRDVWVKRMTEKRSEVIAWPFMVVTDAEAIADKVMALGCCATAWWVAP